jgi:hypothetical protein
MPNVLEPNGRGLLLLEENLMPDSPEADERSAVDWGELIELARELPAQLEAAYARERENLHGIHADEHERALDRMIDLLVDMWTRLAGSYPPGQFDGKDPESFFRDYLAQRLAWRSLLVHRMPPNALQLLEVKRAVLSDAEDAVADTVAAIFDRDDRVMLGVWADWWRKARSLRPNVKPRA